MNRLVASVGRNLVKAARVVCFHRLVNETFVRVQQVAPTTAIAALANIVRTACARISHKANVAKTATVREDRSVAVTGANKHQNVIKTQIVPVVRFAKMVLANQLPRPNANNIVIAPLVNTVREECAKPYPLESVEPTVIAPGIRFASNKNV